ncbi:hypothetical protein, unlikely [Trypanosoma congolense IL3000]|uniref:Uncharacterized protein n=1 Tax=Trypanosoma congolense (strain IL3000) TaxID=1068625 RepID=F9W404_TRYCI|nr:hypothetical protein, unlikely [Trypanosoma congolense IL3000]
MNFDHAPQSSPLGRRALRKLHEICPMERQSVVGLEVAALHFLHTATIARLRSTNFLLAQGGASTLISIDRSWGVASRLGLLTSRYRGARCKADRKCRSFVGCWCGRTCLVVEVRRLDFSFRSCWKPCLLQAFGNRGSNL